MHLTLDKPTDKRRINALAVLTAGFSHPLVATLVDKSVGCAKCDLNFAPFALADVYWNSGVAAEQFFEGKSSRPRIVRGSTNR